MLVRPLAPRSGQALPIFAAASLALAVAVAVGARLVA